MSIRLFCYVLLFLSVFNTTLMAQKAESLNFSTLIPKHPEKNFFSMDNYNVWCNGAVKGDDGKCQQR